MKTNLCFACDREDGNGLSLSSALEASAEGRPVPIVPRGFDQNSSQMSVACLRDPSLAPAAAAAVLGDHKSGGAHELRGFRVAAQVAALGQDRQGGSSRHASQRLEAAGPGRILREVRGLLDESIEPRDPIEPFGDGGQVLLVDGLRMEIFEVDRTDLGPMPLRPGAAVAVAIPAPQ